MPEIYDTEVEEIKAIVKRQAAQIDDIQKQVHQMHNAQRRHLVYKIAWWLIITGFAAYAYYTFLWPMLEPIMQAYGNLQGYQEQMADFFANYRNGQPQ